MPVDNGEMYVATGWRHSRHSTGFSDYFCRAMLSMHKRGLCCRVVPVCPSVWVSVMFLHSAETSKTKFFSPSRIATSF